LSKPQAFLCSQLSAGLRPGGALHTSRCRWPCRERHRHQPQYSQHSKRSNRNRPPWDAQARICRVRAPLRLLLMQLLLLLLLLLLLQTPQ
jgi:hypothetical protein